MNSKKGAMLKNATKKAIKAKREYATLKETAEYLLAENTIEDAQVLLKELGRKMSEDIPMTAREIELYHMTPEQVLDKLEEEREEARRFVDNKGSSSELRNAMLDCIAENPDKFMTMPNKYMTKKDLWKNFGKKRKEQ